MIRIAICDDDPLFMDMVKEKTNDYFLTTEQEFVVPATASYSICGLFPISQVILSQCRTDYRYP